MSEPRFLPSIRLMISILTFFTLMVISGIYSSINFTWVCMTSNSSDVNKGWLTEQPLEWDKSIQRHLFVAYSLGTLLFTLPSGWILDKIGSRMTLTLAMIVSTICTLLIPFLAGYHYFWIVGLRFVIGLFGALPWPTVHNVCSHWATKSEIGLQMVIMLSGFQTGQLVNMLAAGVLCKRVGWESVFFLWSSFGVLITIIWITLFRTDPQVHPLISMEEKSFLAVNSRRNKLSVKIKSKDQQRKKAVPSVTLMLDQRQKSLVSPKDLSNGGERKQGDIEQRQEEAEIPKSQLRTSISWDPSEEEQVSESGARNGTPWIKILTSLPVWSCMVSNFSAFYVIFFVSQFTPTYQQEVLHLSVESNGFASSLPFAVQLLGRWIAGPLSDRSAAVLPSFTFNVKLFNSVAMIGSTACTVGLLFITAETPSVVPIALLSGAVFFMSFTLGGYQKVPLYLAPKYSATISGLCTLAGSMAALSLPYVVAAMTPDGTVAQWRSLFYTIIAVGIVGAVFFAVFASGSRAEWSEGTKKKRKIADAKNF